MFQIINNSHIRTVDLSMIYRLFLAVCLCDLLDNRHFSQRTFEKMYFAIILCKSKKVLAVPEKWIYGLDAEHAANYGINKTEEYLIFYSNNQNKRANFFSPINEVFCPSADFCYKANILKTFGK